MSRNDNFIQIYNHIVKWQKEYDNDFKCIPNDFHASITFNNKNNIIKFIFSNKYLMNDCSESLPYDMLLDYSCIRYDDNNYQYFII